MTAAVESTEVVANPTPPVTSSPSSRFKRQSSPIPAPAVVQQLKEALPPPPDVPQFAQMGPTSGAPITSEIIASMKLRLAIDLPKAYAGKLHLKAFKQYQPAAKCPPAYLYLQDTWNLWDKEVHRLMQDQVLVGKLIESGVTKFRKAWSVHAMLYFVLAKLGERALWTVLTNE